MVLTLNEVDMSGTLRDDLASLKIDRDRRGRGSGNGSVAKSDSRAVANVVGADSVSSPRSSG